MNENNNADAYASAFEAFGRQAYRAITQSVAEGGGDEWTEEMMEIAAKLGLAAYEPYDPDKHGPMDGLCEPGIDSLWWWGFLPEGWHHTTQPRQAMKTNKHAVPVSFRLQWSRYPHATPSRAEVVATKFAEDGQTPTSWTIREGGCTLAKDDGHWEIEPMPSSRDAEYLSRTRWDTAEAAIKFAAAHFTNPPQPR